MDDKQSSPIEGKDKALYAAWQRMLDYDIVSVTQKDDFRNFRQLVVWLTWLISLIAVLFTIFNPPGTQQTDRSVIIDILKLLLIALPFLGLAFMNYAGQFAATTTWIEYRKATEMIRAAIYKYRVDLGFHKLESDKATSDEAARDKAVRAEELSKRQLDLIDKVNEADAWIIENKATVPHMRKLTTNQILQEIANEAREKQPAVEDNTLIHKNSDVIMRLKNNIRRWLDGNDRKQLFVVKLGLTVFSFTADLLQFLLNSIKTMFKTIPAWGRTILAIQLRGKMGETLSFEDHDLAMENLAALSIEKYIEERLFGQRNWYVNNIKKDYLKLRRTRLLIIVLSLIVSVISVYDNWIFVVPVFAALATALTLLANIDMIGRTYVLYQNTAEKLQDRHDQWVAQTEDYRKEPSHQWELVEDIEKILQDENEEWRNESVAIQKTNEAAIYRNLQELVQKNETTTGVAVGKANARTTATEREILTLIPHEYLTPTPDGTDPAPNNPATA